MSAWSLTFHYTLQVDICIQELPKNSYDKLTLTGKEARFTKIELILTPESSKGSYDSGKMVKLFLYN